MYFLCMGTAFSPVWTLYLSNIKYQISFTIRYSFIIYMVDYMHRLILYFFHRKVQPNNHEQNTYAMYPVTNIYPVSQNQPGTKELDSYPPLSIYYTPMQTLFYPGRTDINSSPAFHNPPDSSLINRLLLKPYPGPVSLPNISKSHRHSSEQTKALNPPPSSDSSILKSVTYQLFREIIPIEPVLR